jgi:hypothetical protein
MEAIQQQEDGRVFDARTRAMEKQQAAFAFAKTGREAADIVKSGDKGVAHTITQGIGEPEKNPASTPYASVQAAVNCQLAKDDRLREEAAERSRLSQQRDAADCLAANSVAARFRNNADSKGAGSLYCGN